MNISCVHLKLPPLKPLFHKIKQRWREAIYKVWRNEEKKLEASIMRVRYAGYDLSKTKSHVAHFCGRSRTSVRRQTLESSCCGPFWAPRGTAPSYGVVAQASPQAKDHCPTPCSSCVSRSPIMSLHAGPHWKEYGPRDW